MSEKEKTEIGRTSDVGYSRLANVSGERLSDAQIARGIDDCMRGVIADALRGGSNPQRLDPPERVTPIDAPTVTTAGEKVTEKGWQEPRSLRGSSQTEELIKQLTDHFQPHSPESKAGK